jgi:O-antigen/teichoic acid export membrane protein
MVTFVTRVLGILIGLVTLTLTTRLLGPEGRGQFAVVMATLAMILQFGNAGLHASATYVLAQDPKRRSAVGHLLAWFSAGPVTVLAVAGLLIAWLWPALVPNVPLTQLAIALLGAPPSMFLLLAGNALLGLGRPAAFNLLDLAGRLAGGAAVLLLLVWSDLRIVFGAYAGLHYVAAAAAYVTLVGYSSPRRPDAATARSMMSFGGRVFVVNLAMFLVLRLDLFLLNALRGTADAGIYSVAVQIGDIMMLTSASIAAMLFPRLTAMPPLQRWRASVKVLRVSAAILTLVAVALAAAARPLVVAWFGAPFADATIALYWLLPGLWCLGLNTLLHQHLAAFGMPGFLVASTSVGAVLNALLNAWAIPQYGVVGAAAVSSVTYVVLLAATVWYIGRSGGRVFRA